MNKTVIENFYQLVEAQNLPAVMDCFTEEGYFWDVELARRYRGREIAEGLALYCTAFPNVHRELYEMHLSGTQQVVVVELSLNGTQQGPLMLPWSVIEPTGKNIHVPCCEILFFKGDKIGAYHCYIPYGMLLRQLGVYG